MKNSAFIVIFLVAITSSCSDSANLYPVILIETNMGDIRAELYPEKAPKTVAAFQQLVEDDVYNDATFYRVFKADEMPTDYNTGFIQGGVYGKNKNLPQIPHESTLESGLSHTTGTISMARTKPGTASSEFFICIGDQSPLDAGRRGTEDSLGMAAFGRVIKGMAVVKKIHNLPATGDQLNERVRIQRIKWLN